MFTVSTGAIDDNGTWNEKELQLLKSFGYTEDTRDMWEADESVFEVKKQKKQSAQSKNHIIDLDEEKELSTKEENDLSPVTTTSEGLSTVSTTSETAQNEHSTKEETAPKKKKRKRRKKKKKTRNSDEDLALEEAFREAQEQQKKEQRLTLQRKTKKTKQNGKKQKPKRLQESQIVEHQHSSTAIAEYSKQNKQEAERNYRLASLHIRSSVKKSIQRLKLAAEKGSWQALFALCRRKLNNQNLDEIELREAKVYGDRALTHLDYDKRDVEDKKKLLFNLAHICHTAEGDAADFKRALELYYECGQLGNLNALNSYGVMLRDGEQVQKDERRGMEAIQQAADGGCSVACFNVGMAYLKGMYSYPQDLEKAHHWFKSCWQHKVDGMLNEFHLQFVEKSINDTSYLEQMAKHSYVCAVPKNSAIVGGICTLERV